VQAPLGRILPGREGTAKCSPHALIAQPVAGGAVLPNRAAGTGSFWVGVHKFRIFIRNLES